ncbi:MAG: PilZ domain-containing protein, partial [Deltaproteobacteria bacterium]|nr:PilZ domain-containing protein [Deltaproteobacteria bacterium]
RWTLLCAAITLFAIGKGFWEFHLFGIEKDAYFFNMAWASYNLLFLLAALMVAWERPQRREENRVLRELPVQIDLGNCVITARTQDLSLSGCSLLLDEAELLPNDLSLQVRVGGNHIALRAKLVYHERIQKRYRVGVRFVELSRETRRDLLVEVIADPETWSRAHAASAFPAEPETPPARSSLREASSPLRGAGAERAPSQRFAARTRAPVRHQSMHGRCNVAHLVPRWAAALGADRLHETATSLYLVRWNRAGRSASGVGRRGGGACSLDAEGWCVSQCWSGSGSLARPRLSPRHSPRRRHGTSCAVVRT